MNETPLDRLRRVSLLQWGLIVILAGVATSQLGPPPVDQAAALGRSTLAVLFLVVGVCLVVAHLVPRFRSA